MSYAVRALLCYRAAFGAGAHTAARAASSLDPDLWADLPALLEAELRGGEPEPLRRRGRGQTMPFALPDVSAYSSPTPGYVRTPEGDPRLDESSESFNLCPGCGFSACECGFAEAP